MLGSVALETGMGIILVNILVSTICSTVREGLEAWFKTRAAYLEYSIREMFNDRAGTGIAKSLYNHPLIYSLFASEYKEPKNTDKPKVLASGNNLPSYIPSGNFAIALMDIAARGPATDAVSADGRSPVISLENIRSNIVNIGNEHVQRALLTALDTAQGDLNKAQKNIEEWYNGSMDRVSGWYKRSTYWIIFWIAMVVAVGFNINTITIADYLYRNDAVRQVVVKRAEAVAADTTAQHRLDYALAKAQLDSLGLPIGWNDGWGAPKAGRAGFSAWNDFFAPIIGWLLTALAATLGAPFWFDLLNKMMVIRSTVKPKEKSPDEGSKDAQGTKTSGINGQTVVEVVDRDLAPTKQVVAIPPAVRDKDSSVDGCEVPITTETPDEDLPPSEGGVAQ